MIFGGDHLDLFEQIEQQVQYDLFAIFCTHVHSKLIEAISTRQAFPPFHHSLNLVETKDVHCSLGILSLGKRLGVSQIIWELGPLIPVEIPTS